MSNAELYLGDAFETLNQMPSESIDLILTDPPYLLETRGHGIMDQKVSLRRQQAGLKNIKDGYDIRQMAKSVERLQKNINAYFFCSKKQIPEYFKVYVEEMGCKFDFLSWHKTTNVPPFFYGKYLNDTEYVLHFFKGARTTSPQSFKDASTYFVSPSMHMIGEKRYDHPTQKPLSFVRRLIRNSSKEGGVVLDPFMGSGTTGEAAIIENRNFIGVEYNPKYLVIAANRLKESQSTAKQISIFD